MTTSPRDIKEDSDQGVISKGLIERFQLNYPASEATGSDLLAMLQQEAPDRLKTLIEELGDDETVIAEFMDYYVSQLKVLEEHGEESEEEIIAGITVSHIWEEEIISDDSYY